ncbi:MAG: hypothetical protein A3F95_00475 [Candidatus Nealsonbacteria bacterium RIFCSPLOWO2_12_FULL_39_31]|uniref:DNA methylase N-4/N-6 domain-containing protein n=2 Tax=Candidatus Nealsoniibacteriota TaxID=1817911 RepID=A0A1G2EJP4_9BACT|nr:MAG: hypothetical protein A2626_01610 [Candidatus Nealsonbacteria bacterium RIFCSPHIGHO2_01_FULL_38_55]OGZ21800.1 MAG: hypothetical protein A3C48_01090 [Candidatus Nealsonbacteria bacterium RIFCSPHIGHO2_02_FULL_38_75]OGZ22485.1 MAG: hypothetical protein A2981_00980 [Candidatus Nealsonbacteria bacterium RIFCSPLOWO2_01_FULL_38_120]OGZ23567.1 MAG: hypothetical protein A3E18_01580 [Candidatus Nealsonbacteria bacterium RIFCSPHIGHO2_12_FULL_38_18]OGZ25896.1 MAG: hypothetical protein A3I85_00395 [C
MGYNLKDIWSNSRLHKQDQEREKHPTQKPLVIIDRMIRASSSKNGIVLDRAPKDREPFFIYIIEKRGRKW